VDCPADAGPDLLKRLSLYRLRAKVEIEDVSDRLAVLALWDCDVPPRIPGTLARDPRHPDLGYRAYVAKAAVGPAQAFHGAAPDVENAWQIHRVGLCIPEAGRDYALGEAFPHEIAMDALSGVSFDKGCYVGQEVVSRMEHRGTARRRPAVVTSEAPLPDSGTEILADGRPVGALGSGYGHRGIAVVRLDRVREAVLAGRPVTCGSVPVTIELPAWAPWGWPATGEG
jgi:folate-binding protein YgfZ